jgi:prepilin-type processing-associated H-X9-DG protein
MTSLNSYQKQLLFDYCIGLTSEKETDEAESLTSSNREAAETYAKLKAALAPLDIAAAESCPDDLAESTISRLNNAARSSQLRLQQLLADEQAREASGVKSRFWRNLGKMAAIAAVIVLVSGVLIAPLNFARQKSWQQQCQMQLSRIFNGISQYSSDHDGALPAVATATGEPWWKVGYQGKENYSNTRHIWLLIPAGYANPADFVCPGKSHGKILQFDLSQAKNYNDFPARNYVTYSLRIRCNKAAKDALLGQKVLIADLNPLFEKLSDDYSKPFKLEINKELLNLNSINHNRRGQNVLFCDGSVKFIKMRNIDITKDDIFTLQDTNIYQGCEVPSCEADAFLAP